MLLVSCGWWLLVHLQFQNLTGSSDTNLQCKMLHWEERGRQTDPQHVLNFFPLSATIYLLFSGALLICISCQTCFVLFCHKSFHTLTPCNFPCAGNEIKWAFWSELKIIFPLAGRMGPIKTTLSCRTNQNKFEKKQVYLPKQVALVELDQVFAVCFSPNFKRTFHSKSAWFLATNN